MLRVAVGLALFGLSSAQKCMEAGSCQSQLTQVNEDIREVIADRLQQETEDNLGSAPAAVKASERAFSEGLIPTDVAFDPTPPAEQAKDDNLLIHFWMQLRVYTEVDWLYYGDESTGRFIGYARGEACLENNTCIYDSYATKASPQPTGMNAKTLIRLVSEPDTTKTVLELKAYKTVTEGANAGDKDGLIYTNSSFVTKERTWYKQAKAAPKGTAIWTEPYAFAGGGIGVTSARAYYNSADVLQGVLAADYKLKFLNDFISEIPIAGESLIFLATSKKLLLATNKPGIPVSRNVGGEDVTVHVSDSGDDLVAGVSTEVFKTFLDTDPESKWIELGNKVTRGSATVGGKTYQFDASAIVDQKWVVVVVSQDEDFYTASNINGSSCCEACIARERCSVVIQQAQLDYRIRIINFLQRKTTSFLGTAVTAVSTLDNSYNLGSLHDTFCSTCGTLDFSNQKQFSNLRTHIFHTLQDLPELAWLYMGTDAKNAIGYRREGTTLDLWQTCSLSADCTGDGTAFWSVDSDGKPTAIKSQQSSAPFDKPWYRARDANNLTLDQVAWVDPYTFGNNEIGITVIKGMFGGDFNAIPKQGVWAADFTLAFLSTFLEGVGVSDRTVIYMMTNQGGIMAANKPFTHEHSTSATSGTTVLTKASQVKDNPMIAASATALEAEISRGTWADTTQLKSILTEDTAAGETLAVDAIGIKDAGATRSYDWVLVIAVPISDLADLGDPDEGDDDDGFPGWAIAVIIVGAIVLIAIVAAIVCVVAKKGDAPKGGGGAGGDGAEEMPAQAGSGPDADSRGQTTGSHTFKNFCQGEGGEPMLERQYL